MSRGCYRRAVTSLPSPASPCVRHSGLQVNCNKHAFDLLHFHYIARSEIGDSGVIVTSQQHHHRNMQTPRPSAGEIINEPNYKAEQHLKVISTTKYLLLTAFKYFLMLKYFLRNVGNVCAWHGDRVISNLLDFIVNSHNGVVQHFTEFVEYFLSFNWTRG